MFIKLFAYKKKNLFLNRKIKQEKRKKRQMQCMCVSKTHQKIHKKYLLHDFKKNGLGMTWTHTFWKWFGTLLHGEQLGTDTEDLQICVV